MADHRVQMNSPVHCRMVGRCVDSDLGEMVETYAVMDGELELVGHVLIEVDMLALVADALVGGGALAVVVVDAAVVDAVMVYLQILEDELVEEV